MQYDQGAIPGDAIPGQSEPGQQLPEDVWVEPARWDQWQENRAATWTENRGSRWSA
jgi:hypothetical protein